MGVFLDCDLIMVNQFIFTFRRESGYLLNKFTNEQWSWREDQFLWILMNQKYDLGGSAILTFSLFILTKFSRLFRAICSFMLLSFVNGLFVRIALICSNVILFPLLYLIKIFSPQQITDQETAQIYQQMGVIGALSANFDRQGASKKIFLSGIFYTFFIFSFMQSSCYFFWTMIAFPDTWAGEINSIYFVYSNFLEFFCFIFIRTRTSIKFFPKFITIPNLIFLFYINSYMYAAQTAFLVMLFSLTIAVCFAFLEFFEVPAMQEWNPFNEATPRHTSPRIGY